MGTPISPGRRRLFRIALALGLPALLLGGAEAGLRIAGFSHEVTATRLLFVNPDRQWAETLGDAMTITDPDLFWRLKPGWRGPHGSVVIGPSGYRTPPFRSKKRFGWHRVVCIGDSITFGLTVAEPGTFPRLLEGRIRTARTSNAVEVINLGVVGYTAAQGLRVLESEALALGPDVVICTFGAFNDWVPAVEQTDLELANPPPVHDLRLLQLVASLRGGGTTEDAAEVQGVEEAKAIVRDLETRNFTGRRRVPPADFENLLRRIGETASATGARVVFVASPLPAKTVERNPVARDYAEITRRVAENGGHVFVDGWEAFRATGSPDDDLFADFCHPGPLGHKILAHAIGKALAADREPR